MLLNDQNKIGTSLCKFCAENGFPNVVIYWKCVGQKDDGTPKWVPFEDINYSVRHSHRQLGMEFPKVLTIQTQTNSSDEAITDEPAIFSYQNEYLSNVDVIFTLNKILESNQKQHQLLRELIDTIRYRTD